MLRPWFSTFSFLFKCCKSAFSHSSGHPRPREVQMQANYVQLCFYQPNVMKMRGGNCLFEDKTTMVLSLGQGAGQPHGAQPRVVEMSARGLLRTQNRAAGTQKRWLGPCWETLASLDPARGAGCPQYPQGYPGHSLFHTLPFPVAKRIRKSVLSPNTLLQTWAQGILVCSRGAVGCSGCYSTTCCHGLSRDHHWVKVLPGTAVLALWSLCTSLCKLSVLIVKFYPHAKNICFG